MDHQSKEYQEKLNAMGLTAPKVTPEKVESVIKSVGYALLPSGKCMVCEIILENGFSVRGEASAVSAENFNSEIGEEISYKKAKAKIWHLEGYLLQQKLYEESKKEMVEEEDIDW